MDRRDDEREEFPSMAAGSHSLAGPQSREVAAVNAARRDVRFGGLATAAGAGVAALLRALRAALGVAGGAASQAFALSQRATAFAVGVPTFLTSRLLLPVERTFLRNPVLSPYLLTSLDLSKSLASLSISALDGTVHLSLQTVSAIAQVLADFVSPEGSAGAAPGQGMIAVLLAFLELVRRETLGHDGVRQLGILQLLRGIVAWMVIQGMTRQMWAEGLRGVRKVDVDREKRLSLLRSRRGAHHRAASATSADFGAAAGSLNRDQSSSIDPGSLGRETNHSRRVSGGSTWSAFSRVTNYTTFVPPAGASSVTVPQAMPSSLHRGSSLRSVDSQPGQDIFSEDGDEDVGPSISARGYSPVLPHDSDSEMEDLPPFPIGSVSEYPTWSAEPNTVPPPQHRASIQRDYGFLPPPDNPPPSAGDRPAPLDIERLVSRLHALDSEHTLEGEDELLDPIEGGGEELEVVLTLRDEEREMDLVEGYIPDVPGGAVEPEPEDVEMEEEEWLAKRRSYLSLKSERSEQAEATVPSSPTGVKLVEDPMDEAILVHGGPFDLRRIRRYSAVSTGAYGPGLKLFRVLYDRTFGSGAKPPKARSKKDPPDEERRFSKHFEGRRSSSVSFAPSGTATPRAGDSLHPDEHQILANHAGTRLSAIIHSSFMDEQPARGLGLGIGQMLGAFGPEMAMPNGHGAVPPMRSSHSEPGENAGAPPASPDGDAHPAPPLPSESWNHPTFYILADRPAHSIVVVLRGTATVSEVMVDMTCEYEEFSLDPSWADAERELLGRAGGAPAPFLVHGGILRAAHHLAGRGSRFLRHLARALEENPGFTLTLVGHSLGAGLASLLGCMWVERGKWMTRRGIGLPEGRRVKVFAYGNPAVMDIRLSLLSRPLITSIIFGYDLFPRLCVGSVLDLRDVVLALCSPRDGGKPGMFSEVTERAFNYMRRSTAAAGSPRAEHPDEASDSGTATPTAESPPANAEDRTPRLASTAVDQLDPDLAWFWSLRKTLSAAIDTRPDGETNEKLYPAGRLLWIRRDAAGKYDTSEIVDPREVLGKIEFAEGIVLDHIPLIYDDAVRAAC